MMRCSASLSNDNGRTFTKYEGNPVLTPFDGLKDMIFNEYHKEMFGEGQVWYNMKRLNKDIESNVELRTIPASEDIYVLPIPQDEYNYRN